LALVPGNRPELLGGNRKVQYCIRINDQYRVCFGWKDLGTSAEFWLGLQLEYDLRTERQKVGAQFAKQVKAREQAA